MAAFVGLIAAGVVLLITWIASPVFKDVIVSVTESWGVAVGLDGLALVIANIMPILLPAACFGVIIVGLVGLVRGSR